MTDVNPNLMADLARLAARYPPEDWRTVIQLLEDPVRRKEVVLLLEQLAVASDRRNQSRKRSRQITPQPAIPDVIRSLSDAEPERARALEDLWRGLRHRDLLPRMTDLRTFAESIGLKGLPSTKRDQAVNALIRHLVLLPPDDCDAALTRPLTAEWKVGEDYGRWVAHILGPGKVEPDRSGPIPQAGAPEDSS